MNPSASSEPVPLIIRPELDKENSSSSPPSLASSTCTSASNTLEIPTHWRPETESCINRKILTKESRSDIVRTLVTLTIAKYGSRPTRNHCQQFARQLILQYPFLKDDIGNGYVSAKW